MVMSLLSIYICAICGVVTHEVLILLYAMAYKKGGVTAVTVYVMTALLLWYCIFVLTQALTFLSCDDFARNVVVPFLMKQPIALVTARADPKQHATRLVSIARLGQLS